VIGGCQADQLVILPRGSDAAVCAATDGLLDRVTAATAGGQCQRRGHPGNRRNNVQHQRAPMTRCMRSAQVLADSGRKGPAC
jgi:hypothetical protein